jgi:hypothetical protein
MRAIILQNKKTGEMTSPLKEGPNDLRQAWLVDWLEAVRYLAVFTG